MSIVMATTIRRERLLVIDKIVPVSNLNQKAQSNTELSQYGPLLMSCYLDRIFRKKYSIVSTATDAFLASANRVAFGLIRKYLFSNCLFCFVLFSF